MQLSFEQAFGSPQDSVKSLSKVSVGVYLMVAMTILFLYQEDDRQAGVLQLESGAQEKAASLQSKLTEVEARLSTSEGKLSSAEGKLAVSEEKLSLLEQEKLRIEKVRVGVVNGWVWLMGGCG